MRVSRCSSSMRPSTMSATRSRVVCVPRSTAATRMVARVRQALRMWVALALGSSLVWGTADFLGGFFTRRAPLSAVTVVSQAAGLCVLLVWLAARGFHLAAPSFALGLLAGVG